MTRTMGWSSAMVMFLWSVAFNCMCYYVLFNTFNGCVLVLHVVLDLVALSEWTFCMNSLHYILYYSFMVVLFIVR